MSEVYPLIYPEDTVENSRSFAVNDVVRIVDPSMDLERYQIVEVIGQDDVAQYAVVGLQTGARFSYYSAHELRSAPNSNVLDWGKLL